MLEASYLWILWIKALHIISVIAWMAGMLYLPRLYVYHCRTEAGSASAQMLEVMERRLLRGIINPAMAAAFVFGILLLATPGLIDWGLGWIWVKLACVLALGGLHGALSRWRRDFAAGANRHSERFYRIANEVPTVLLTVIVVLAVVKPF
jgi:putative membrane protein